MKLKINFNYIYIYIYIFIQINKISIESLGTKSEGKKRWKVAVKF